MIIDFLTLNLKHALSEEVARAESAETALRAESFASAVYDSGDTAIYFYNADDEVLSTIDCTDFIVDGMIDNVTLSGSILTITFNTDSGKQDITIDLSEFINPENYYTKDEVNSAITEATEDFVTSGDVKTQIEAYNYITSADTANFVTSGDVETQINGKSFATSASLVDVEYVISVAVNELNDKVDTLSGNCENFITSADTANFVTSGDVETQITGKNYITSGDAKTQIEAYNYVNSGDVKTQIEGYDYVTSGDVETQITGKNYITSGDVETQITGKNYITSGDVKTQIEAYNYITSAATQNMVTSTDITSIVKISQADYDLLPSKDPNTLYVII